ncbi:MAG: GerMN domain-containing protein [Treponema sp.]|nr:GerMN domain-containing protein [Treponema sp.]
MLKVIIFWLFFFIFISCLFLINWDRIRNTIQNAHFPLWFSKKVLAEQSKVQVPQEQAPPPPQEAGTLSVGRTEPQTFPQAWPQQAEELEPEDEQKPAPRVLQDSPILESFSPGGGVPAPLSSSPPNPISMTLPPVQPSPEAVPRSRSLYFIQLDAEGTILRSKVSRSLPNSDAPLGDVLQALLDGPSAEEQHQGLISLIPPATKLLSLMIRLETAYINLSEDFLYTPYGSEAYAAQLQQLIWTATEFPNIQDVQLLIEGKKLDYLGDITWIGSPVGRDSF